MMSKFIKLHFPIEGKVSFNVEDILCFFERDDDTIIRAKDGNCYAVTESYEELKQLIHDAGCLIHKPDPRLNLTSPVTMDDLREMIGEPVWNSNNNQWLIMAHYLDTKENPIAGLYNKNGYLVEFTADDLIRTPLYCMKQEVK